MVETEFFLELLMGLLADPARLDGAGDIPDRRICGQVREIIFALAAGAMLADQPCFFPGHVLRARGADALRRAVGDADAHDGKARAQASLRSPTPTDLSPFCVVEHGVGGAHHPGHRDALHPRDRWRSEEHTSELQSLMRISYAVFCLKKKNKT